MKVIFLDRDGTINTDTGRVSAVKDFRFIDKVPEALKKLQRAGFKLAVVTNQTGVGAGYYTLDQMHTVNGYMERELEKHGVKLETIAFCPHSPDDDCDCRKPKTGMADQIEEKIGEIDYESSWMIGDKERDLRFGKNVGTATALIESSYWEEDSLKQRPDLIVSSLWDFATRVVG